MPDHWAGRQDQAVNEVSFEVPGNPPLKNEAISVFNAKHGQAERIRTLLEAAQRACQEEAFVPVEQGSSVALTVIARSPEGDAANIIGGIADVLEHKPSKSYRSAIDHLGDLATVWLYRNDSQIKQIEYREEPGEPGYRVTVRVLANPAIWEPGNHDLSAANTESDNSFRHLGIVITLTGTDCAFMVRLKESRLLRDDSYEEVAAGDGAKFVAVRTQVLNDSMVSIDLTCGYPIRNHLIDERGRQFDQIQKLYRIPGNPRCNDNLQPGFATNMTWIYRVPFDANITAFEFEDLTDFGRDRSVKPTRIPLTIPAPQQEMPMADPERQSGKDQPGRMGSSGVRQEPGSPETATASSGNLWEPEDWPPVSFAENDHILVWWLPEYDDVLRELVDEYQWAWRSAVFQRLETVIPEAVLRAWRQVDPLCEEWSWYNVLSTFAAARAKQLGIHPRPARRTVCSCCSSEFLESQLSYAFIARVGANGIDVCWKCLGQALYAKGSPASASEAVIAVLQALSGALQRPPKISDLSGRLDLKGLSRDSRATVIQALRVKPTIARVKELFGSWDAAVAHAAAAPLTPLPPYEPMAAAPPAADTEFTSNDPARYRSVIGPLPEIRLDASREPWTYREEVESLIGTGYLALAEATLVTLKERDPSLHYFLAQLYGQTARFDAARAAFEHQWPDSEELPVDLLRPRDLRTITFGPVFYEPLSSGPRGNARFVLVGGPMEYVDRRGEHRCVTGESPEGGIEAELAESVSRMNAMVHGVPWLQAATETGQAIITSLARAGADPRPYGHEVSWVTSTFRDIVKALTGARPKKVAEDAWHIGPVGKSGWSYQREADHFVFNANADFSLMTVEAAPAVCIWSWPDRSDLCLQAFVDTVAVGAPDPVTVLLPDVPAFRDFARRYVRGEHMEKSERVLVEESFYRFPGGGGYGKPGYVLSAEFAPRLIVHSDGTEDDGTILASALAYLDAHHTLRLSVWGILSDTLLREAATGTPVAARPSAVPESDRADMVRWYARLADVDDVDALLRPYRPSLLDAVVSA